MVAAQPLRARAGPALSPRQGAGDAHGAAVSGPRLQPLPDVRRPAAVRPGGDREGLRAARADGEAPLPPLPRRPEATRYRAAAGDARRGDRADRGVRTRAAHARRAHVQPLRGDQAAGMGGLPGAGHAVGAGALPAGDLDPGAIARAREAGRELVRRTPVLSSRTIARRCGAPAVALKAENLQRTGSFKLRGALAKLAALGDAAKAGVVTGSAGNHAQSLAYAAQARGVPCEVFMPAGSSIAKADSAADLGARVQVVEGPVDDSIAAAHARARDGGLAFVHPFDDLDVIAGQATLGLELLDDVADLAKVIVPVGGGGLACGMAIAIKTQRPDVEVVGVQAEVCAPFADALRTGGAPAARPASALTI